MSNINKSLVGLNYYTRAKERKGPIDDHLPVLDGDNAPKLRILLVRHGESQVRILQIIMAFQAKNVASE
jgi:hypothetical protein